MSTLLLFLPPRQRLHVSGAASPADGSASYVYLLTTDGQQVSAEGSLSAEQLPRADTVIAVPAPADIAWQHLTLPRAGRQMRQALAGQLEDLLLDEPEGLHFALEPEAQGGDGAWVAVCARSHLEQHLSRLEAAHVFVDRIVPLGLPEGAAQGHFSERPDGQIQLCWSSAEDGVLQVLLAGGLSRQLFPESRVQATKWTATPSAAAQAEQWLGAAVSVLSPAQRALALVKNSRWDLRQFELASRTRGIRALRQGWREFMHSRWRLVRWGLIGLVVVHLLGLNLHAWQQSRLLAERKKAVEATLRQAHPQVRAILDAPLQMQRETELLRTSAGRAGDQDLETLLAAAATAWPADRGPLDALSFEIGRLGIPAQGWSEAQIQQFRSRLQSEGWSLETREGRLSLSRAASRNNKP